MRGRAVAALFVLVGCNKLLDLEHVDDPSHAGGDGGGVFDGGGDGDGFPHDDDAPPAVPDEDLDGIPDISDPCPTVISNATDQDLDGLPDACDPSSETKDAIDKVWLFRDQTDTGSFDLINATWNGLGNGSIQAGTDASIQTKVQYLPTRIEVNVRGAGAIDMTGAINVALPTIVACYVVAQGCSGSTIGTCGTVVPSPNTGAQLGVTINGLRRIWFSDQSGARCSISSNSATVTANGTATFAPSKIAVTTNSKLSIFIDSIVIYRLQP